MKVIQNIEAWGNTHHPKILDIIRILLGAFLLIKGINFLNNIPYLRLLIVNTIGLEISLTWTIILINAITLIHLIGGTMILLGLLTRIAALMQIPVLLSAVFFVNIFNSFYSSELWVSIIMLFLLVIFVILGSGPISVDAYLFTISNSKKQKKRLIKKTQDS